MPNRYWRPSAYRPNPALYQGGRLLPRFAATRSIPLVLAVGAGLIGAVLAKDAFNGSKEYYDTQVAQFQQKNAYKDIECDFAHWSGQPLLDRIGHNIYRSMLYGPFDIFTKWNEFKCQTERVFSALFAGGIPLAVSVGALYAGLGADRVHYPFKTAFRYVWDQVRWPTSWGWCKTAGRVMGDGLARVINSAGRHPGVTLGALLVGAFTVGRIKDCMTHDAQDQFFRAMTSDTELE